MTNLERTDEPIRPYARFRRVLAEQGIDELAGVSLKRMVHVVHGAFDQALAACMRAQSVSEPRWRLLFRLMLEEKHGAAWVNPTQLSRAQSVSTNTISAHLRALEEQGLIERAVDPDDLRQFRIRLTDAGRRLVIETLPGHIAYTNELVSDLSPAEIEQLHLLLSKLLASLARHGNLPAHCVFSPHIPPESAE